MAEAAGSVAALAAIRAEMLGVAPAIVAGWIAELQAPYRHYHTLAHVAAIERAYRALGGTDPVMIAAAWLHDIRYDPTRNDNEAVSAEIARADLAGSGLDLDRVARIVLDTRDHRGGDADTDLFGDLDLAILGAPPAHYRRYLLQIRAEYAFVPLATYATVRAGLLRAFDTRRIFKTAAFADREASAHANLQNEIALLERHPEMLDTPSG